MAVLSVQDEFQSGDNVTATNLNNLVKDASFNADTTDNSTLEVHTTGYLKVKDLGVDTQHLADGAVETAKIANGAVETDKIGNDQVTYDKMQDVAAFSVIGNNTNATATPTAISIDDLKDNISNATQTADGLMSSTDKTKLDGIDAGAEENVQSDWNQTTNTADDFIKNKPNVEYTSPIPDATTSAGGLMSSTDKTKLDGIATGATANTGTVTSVSGSGGISGTVTTSGSLSLSNSGVTAGTYTNATVTVDSKGRVTSASSGSSGGSSIVARGLATGNTSGGWTLSSSSGCTITGFGQGGFHINVTSGTSGAVCTLGYGQFKVTSIVNDTSNNRFTINTNSGSPQQVFFMVAK